jgi:hypothetical protein
VYSLFGENYVRRTTLRSGESIVNENLPFEDRVTAIAMTSDGSHFWSATSSGNVFISDASTSEWTSLGDRPSIRFWLSLAVNHLDESILFGLSEDGSFWMHRQPPAPVGNQGIGK